MFEGLPLTGIISFVGIILMLVFFVTSSDSGSLVIDSITAGGKTDAPTAQRVFWVVMEGAIAAALIFGGGDDALGAIQAVAISAGLPFTVRSEERRVGKECRSRWWGGYLKEKEVMRVMLTESTGLG